MENLKKLSEIGINIIKEEGLPIPTKITFADTYLGTRRRKGCCTKDRTNDTFKIRINLRTAQFTYNEKGKYKCRKTGKRLERIMGKLLSFDEIKETLAHEIAHLKFWKHDQQHHSYTNHILTKINMELKNG